MIASLFFSIPSFRTSIYTLSLHDALPISHILHRGRIGGFSPAPFSGFDRRSPRSRKTGQGRSRSEEHTSELQSRQYLVCRLLLEKKKKKRTPTSSATS